jgi:uncharacterized membrane protein YeaQ/YmgE (transglycosylase-associated protein family)
VFDYAGFFYSTALQPEETALTILAALELEPATIAIWLAVGLVCGWLAGKVMEEASYGILGDLGLGVFGALVGAGLLTFFGGAFWISILVASLGAAILIVAGRAVAALRSA